MLKGLPGNWENTQEKTLRSRLMDEFRSPTSPQPFNVSLVELPLIVFSRSGPFERIHLTVVWDDPDWVNLDFASRCEITMRAFSDVFPALSVEVSSAVGTTTEEASSLGIDVEEILEKGPDLTPEDLMKK